jgi:hypothetical protein
MTRIGEPIADRHRSIGVQQKSKGFFEGFQDGKCADGTEGMTTDRKSGKARIWARSGGEDEQEKCCGGLHA